MSIYTVYKTHDIFNDTNKHVEYKQMDNWKETS